MSTIDMTQVAGLQTVDAEGNVIGTLSVDDLTNLVANNLVKSTQNQIAAARSVSTMSEASTLAASDDYENTLPIDANPASVRTLDSEGNPKQTGISAFAQVVGGLIPEASINLKGLQSAANVKKQGRIISSTGSKVYKITSSNNHYTHYSCLLHVQSPASGEPAIYAIASYNDLVYVTLLCGVIRGHSFYKGQNTSNNMRELYIQITDTSDHEVEEFCRIGGLNTFEEVSAVPSYCEKVSVKFIP